MMRVVPKVDGAEDERRAAKRQRLTETLALPEAQGRGNLLPFALACRFDLPMARVKQALVDAPEMTDPNEVAEWAEAYPVRSKLEIVK
jgi:hypothetical protein